MFLINSVQTKKNSFLILFSVISRPIGQEYFLIFKMLYIYIYNNKYSI